MHCEATGQGKLGELQSRLLEENKGAPTAELYNSQKNNNLAVCLHEEPGLISPRQVTNNVNTNPFASETLIFNELIDCMCRLCSVHCENQRM